MKKLLAVLFILTAIQGTVFADAETDMQQSYIARIQAQDIKYNTLNFFAAIKNGNTQLVDLFLKSGMSPDSTFMKVPALYMAIQSGQNAVVKQLLDANVNPNKELAGTSPLIAAIRCKDSSIVETLISYGADVNKEVGYTKPLAYAIQKKQPKIVELLIAAGAKPDNEVLIRALKSDDTYIKDTVLRQYKKMD